MKIHSKSLKKFNPKHEINSCPVEGKNLKVSKKKIFILMIKNQMEFIF